MTPNTGSVAVQAAINAAQLPGRLSVIDPIAWQGQFVPQRPWLVHEWIPMRCVTSLYGDGGTGKSLLAMQLITAAATGKRWAGLEVSPVRAFGYFCEDDKEELQRRQVHINHLYGVDMVDLENVNYVSGVGEDNILMAFDDGQAGNLTSVYHSIERHALEFGAQLVVIDTAADTFGGDENKRPQVRRFIGQLTALALKINGAVLLCAHPSAAGLHSGRGDGGSTAWNNSVRSRLYFNTPSAADGEEENPDIRILSRKKANYAARNDEIKLTWQEGVFIPQARPGFGKVDSIARQVREKDAEEVFLKLLGEFEGQGRPLSSARTSTNFAPTKMMTSPQRQGLTKKELVDAMERLFHKGEIREEAYGRGSNPPKKITATGA